MTSEFEPCIYSQYYFVNKDKVEIKKADVKQFENTNFYCEDLFFTTDMKNVQKYHEQENEKSFGIKLQKANIKELDKKTTFKILKFTEEGIVYVKLSDGTEGYIFPSIGYFAG